MHVCKVSTHTHTPDVSMYLIEYVRIPRVEEVRQPFLYAFNYLRPHRVNQEIITRHCVSFVTEEREHLTYGDKCRICLVNDALQ